MPQKDMPKEVSIMGGCPLFGVSSHLLNLAEGEAALKAKKARLRAQQRGRVATRKKGRLRAALRHLWGKTKVLSTDAFAREASYWASSRSLYRRKVHRAEQPRRPGRQSESGEPLRALPPEEKKG